MLWYYAFMHLIPATWMGVPGVRGWLYGYALERSGEYAYGPLLKHLEKKEPR